MFINLDHCFKKNNEIISKKLGEEISLIDPYRQRLIKLNPMAAEIWALLDEGHSVSRIIGTIQEKFEVGKEVAERDALDFLKELLRREIIY